MSSSPPQSPPPLSRKLPNIVITGTPGVGKTVHCEQLASDTGLKHVSVNAIVKETEAHEGWDEELGSWIVDEDKLLDNMETWIPEGGNIIDWHACDLFPKRWIDLVVVLRCPKTDVLFDRLSARDYGTLKLQENIDAEIFQVLLEEAREAYDEEIVVELKSETDDDIDANVARIVNWVEAFKLQHSA